MNKSQNITLALLQLSMGWIFIYAGVTKIINPEWSAAGYLNNAGTLNSFFSWLATPANIDWVNFLNMWGLTIIGVALVLGICVKYASWAGFILMILYYLPILNFPYAGDHSLLIDDHIIYAIVFLVLIFFSSQKAWSIRKFIKR